MKKALIICLIIALLIAGVLTLHFTGILAQILYVIDLATIFQLLTTILLSLLVLQNEKKSTDIQSVALIEYLENRNTRLTEYKGNIGFSFIHFTIIRREMQELINNPGEDTVARENAKKLLSSLHKDCDDIQKNINQAEPYISKSLVKNINNSLTCLGTLHFIEEKENTFFCSLSFPKSLPINEVLLPKNMSIKYDTDDTVVYKAGHEYYLALINSIIKDLHSINEELEKIITVNMDNTKSIIQKSLKIFANKKG